MLEQTKIQQFTMARSGESFLVTTGVTVYGAPDDKMGPFVLLDTPESDRWAVLDIGLACILGDVTRLNGKWYALNHDNVVVGSPQVHTTRYDAMSALAQYIWDRAVGGKEEPCRPSSSRS